MKKYKEIFRLKEMLEKENIPFIFRDLFDGFQINYPDTKNRECSVIEHKGSYGHNQDKLEIMGLLTDKEAINDDVVGYLTAEDVFNRIYKHYKEQEMKKQWYYFTFFYGSENRNRYVKFYGTFVETREQMFKHFGDKWAFQYDEEQFAVQIEMFGLQELKV